MPFENSKQWLKISFPLPLNFFTVMMAVNFILLFVFSILVVFKFVSLVLICLNKMDELKENVIMLWKWASLCLVMLPYILNIGC